MSKPTLKMQSWQIFHFARKHLGSSVLYAIFGKKNARAIDFWAQDPRYTNKADGAYDPIRGIKTLIETLDDHGHEDVVRSTLSYISEETSAATSTEESKLTDLQPTIAEEIVRDYKAVSELQDAIENEADMDIVDALKEEAIDEIARTVALYKQINKG